MASKEARYFTTAADTNETALFKLKRSQIGRVLMDFILTGRDGNRLARLIRKSHILVPVLVVSGNRDIYEEIIALGAALTGQLAETFIAVNWWPTSKQLFGK